MHTTFARIPHMCKSDNLDKDGQKPNNSPINMERNINVQK